MNSRSKYKTKQSQILLEYLESVPGVHITASDVYEYFKKQGASIGQATVYRQLESLVDEGLLSKYTVDPNSPACFEYAGQHVHDEGEICFHGKCEKCGKLIHFNCEELEEIKGHLYAEHHFSMDPIRTVFYGLCERCMESSVSE
jgi:Fur family ferric uptake transcriptional regulator